MGLGKKTIDDQDVYKRQIQSRTGFLDIKMSLL